MIILSRNLRKRTLQLIKRMEGKELYIKELHGGGVDVNGMMEVSSGNSGAQPGIISGGTIAENDPADGIIDVAAGTGLIRASDSDTADLISFSFDATEDVELVNNALNYILVNYHATTPFISVITDLEDYNYNTQIPIAVVFRRGNEVEIVAENGVYIQNYQQKIWHRLIHRGIERMSGGIVSETGERYLIVSEAIYYLGLIQAHTVAVNTSLVTTFDAVYRDGSGGWRYIPLHQFSNIHYDDGDGTPGNVGIAKYAVYWVYQCLEGDIYIQYAQADNYTLTTARASQPPTPPQYLANWAYLIAKIIIKNGDTNATEVLNTYAREFVPIAASSHGELSDLGVDDHTQYLNATRGDIRYLHKENTDPFTPDADYEPATKKYVDDSGGGAGADLSYDYGDASDGEVIIAEETTLDRDMCYSILTINEGVTLNLNGFKIFVRDTFINSGTVSTNGTNGSDGGTGEGAGEGISGTSGQGGEGTIELGNDGSITGKKAGVGGGDGGFGGEMGQPGANGINGTEGLDAFDSFGLAGATGAEGGNGGDSHSQSGGDGGADGTTGGAMSAMSASAGSIRNLTNLTVWRVFNEFGSAIQPTYHGGSAGSGGGGGGAGDVQLPDLAWGGGGGGGAGSAGSGGCMYIAAKNLHNEGLITASGGAGGTGGDGGNGFSVGATAIGGGGGGGAGGSGGSGGYMVIVSDDLINNGVIIAAGGNGGLGGEGGTGANGGNGVNGNEGETGTVGEIVYFGDVA